MKCGLIGLIVLATWGSSAAATSGVAQDARPTFRARTELVTVAATVRTRRGRPVVNLKASDFQVLDNGVPRTISDFKSEPAPVSVALVHRIGRYYSGDYQGWRLTLGLRAGARLLSEVEWNYDDVNLPVGRFRNDLLPIKISYAFTSLASVQGLIQYNKQTATLSSNIRLALLNRSGTGFFLVYNDRRDTSDFTADTLLGRSFIVKYTRLVDF